MFLNEIEKEEINKLDVHQFEGKINVVESMSEFASSQ